MIYRNTIITIVLAFAIAGNLVAQVELFTDRTIYATGEEILFSAFINKSGIQEDKSWSKVLYVNLIRPDGTSVSRGKYSVSGFTSDGYLPVPDQLLTGNYYLVAYTRWMQNFSPANYEFKRIRIINPFNSELESSCLQVSSTLPYSRREGNDFSEDIVICKSARSKYKWGEEVQISLLLSGQFSQSYSPFSIVSGRPEVLDSMLYTSVQPDSIYFRSPDAIQYPPDLMGLSISGRVIQKGSGKPIQYAHVELSVLGQDQQFLTNFTEEDGSFVFGIDSMSGSHELFISARDPEGKNMEIRVDNDFAISNFTFSPRPFTLTEDEQQEAERIMLNAQLVERYREPPPGSPESRHHNNDKFYGSPSAQILIDNFVQLPTFYEVVVELIPGVYPVKRNKKTVLQFTGNVVSHGFMSYHQPLILLDQVPVYDLEKLLVLSPQKLHSIEIVNELYFIGNTMYGGIMSISSRNGDMAGIDLPANSFFFDFDAFLPQPSLDLNFVADRGEEDNLPDLRNTLYWETGLDLKPGITKNVSLPAPNRSGRYIFLARGMAADGKIIQGKCSFMVE